MSVFEVFKNVSDLSDTVSIVFTCAADSTVLVTLEGITSEYFIPSIKVAPGDPWSTRVQKEITQEIFGCTIGINRALAFRKFWIPHFKSAYLLHTVFEILVTPDQKKKSKNPFGRFRGRIVWVTEDDLKKQAAVLKTPEMRGIFCKRAFTYNVPEEFHIFDNFLEITENVLISGRSSSYEQLINASGINRLTQEVLYREFLWMSYPCIYMGFQAFAHFVNVINWSPDEASHLFRAADLNQRGGISFREFLYFLAVVDPTTNHSGAPAEIRCRYVFRYLDRNKTNHLNKEDIKRFIILIRKFRKQSLEETKVDMEVSAFYINNGWHENHNLTLAEFLKAVGELKIRGTSQILKAPLSIQKYVKDCLEKDIKLKGAILSQDSSTPTTSSANLKPYVKTNEYVLASHVVQLFKNGDPKTLEELLSHDMSVSSSSQAAPLLNEVSRRFSRSMFYELSSSNEILRWLHYLSDINKKTPVYMELNQLNFTWGHIDHSAFAKHLLLICTKVKDIFLKEPRMLDLSAPIYILGDIHGNFPDLLNLEKLLWQMGPELCPCSFLFLGDYVDRGLYSLEVICYLFSYKAKVPKKMFMVRGNHEIKRIQMQWTFEKECLMKFGSKLGMHVFNAINDAFDCMPLTAVIDGRVFCCHGGIPPPWLCPIATAINDIPSTLNDPQEQSSLAWELMWNDPIGGHGTTDKVSLELLANEGFAPNTRRGTGHVFNAEALEKFLKTNGFTHMIRAHEPADEGFNVQLKGKLLTVFSSSNYCGGQNGAACILADQLKLRVFKFK